MEKMLEKLLNILQGGGLVVDCIEPDFFTNHVKTPHSYKSTMGMLIDHHKNGRQLVSNDRLASAAVCLVIADMVKSLPKFKIAVNGDK
jgi:hypothetical protein